ARVGSHAGPPAPLRSLTALLPPDVAVLTAEAAPDGFSARHDARSRTYLYRVHTRRAGPSPFELGRAVWWPHRIDLDALHECADALQGTHDFTAFTPTATYHQRFHREVLAVSWQQAGPELLEFRIEA